MAISDVFPLEASPSCLNAYYTRAARVVEFMKGVINLPKRTWQRRYQGAVTSYDLTGKGVQSRILAMEQRRINARFCTDWQMWHNGCEPQDFNTQTLGRPGLSEKWAHLLRLQKNTCFYNLETIVANTMNLAKRLEGDMEYLGQAQNDIYDEYFLINHLANSDRRFMAWQLSAGPPATATFGEKVPGTQTPAWRWGTDADGCRFCGERIYLAVGITAAEVQPLMAQSLQILQGELAGTTSAYTLEGLTIITDAFTQANLVRNDSSLVQAMLYKVLNNGSSLNPSLAANHAVLEFFKFETDPLPWRGFYDPDNNSAAGEVAISRIDPFLDDSIEEGLESEENPDYKDPNIAAFQIDVPWIGPTYEPARAMIPDRVGRVVNHNQVWANWEWINNKDMAENKHGDKGFFSLRDNMLSSPKPLSRRAPIILSRRAPLEFTTFVLPELGTPSATSAVSTTDCESVQWKQNDPLCPYDSELGYGYDFESSSGNCDGCQ